MLILRTRKIEKALNIKIIPFLTCMGVDTASRTGWCRLSTDPDNIRLDYGFISIKTPDKYFKYNQYIEIFKDMLLESDILIIEESFYGRNVKVFQMLSRLGGFVYALAHLNGVKEKRFLLATSARKNIGLKGNLKKEIIQKIFCEKIDLEIEDNDIIDSIILALNGVIERKEIHEQDRPTHKRTKQKRL